MRRIVLVLIAVLAFAGVLASCSLPVAYPPDRNAEDRPGPDFTIWMRNIGYPCAPPLWPLTTDDRNWESGIPGHGCVFEYTWMYDIGWCYSRDLALYGSAPTGAGNCEGLEWGTWNTRLFRYSLNHVLDGTFGNWCLDHDMSCAPLDAPWRTNMARSLDLSLEEIVAADLAAAAEYQEEDRGVTDLGASVSDYSLDEQVSLYWDLGNVGAMDADEQAAVEAMGDATPTVEWREEHRPYAIDIPVLDKDHFSIKWKDGTWKPDTCEAPYNLPRVFNQGGRKPVCWTYSWQWHAGWCGPLGEPFYPQNPGDYAPTHYCPNGNWPLDSTTSAPLMAWDDTLQWWKPTAAAEAWIDGQFATGWTPTAPQ